MMTKLISSALLLFTLPLATAVSDTKPTFNCPGNSVCREFTDGCNSCRAPDGNTALAGCTEMYCLCYDDDSCVPECTDNPQCVVEVAQAAAPVPEFPPPETIRFDCTGSTVCMEYTDGCNRCANPLGDFSIVGCTEMWCECYENNTCVPECLSSDLCVPAKPAAGPGAGTGAGSGADVVIPAPQKCTPSALDKELCPVDSVGCAAPPPSLTDCTYKPGNFVKDREGNCCENQCIFVDSLGKRCNWVSDEVAPGNPTLELVEEAKENLKLSMARGGEGGGFGGFRQRRLKGGRSRAN